MNYIIVIIVGITTGFCIWLINLYPPWRTWKRRYQQTAGSIVRAKKEISGTLLRMQANSESIRKDRCRLLFFYAVMIDLTVFSEISVKPASDTADLIFYISGRKRRIKEPLTAGA